MAKFRKAVLRVGKYHSPDGVVEVTPARLNHWAVQHAKLTQAKQVVPIAWDHADNESDLQPVAMDAFNRRKRSAKNTVGHLKEFRVSDDGQSAELTLDVHDQLATAKASDNSVFVSPVILSKWQDGAANVYHDVITHVDFVNHPVDHSQGPFEPATETIACALRMGLSTAAYWGEEEADMAIKRMGPNDAAEGFFTKGGKTFPITSGLEEGHKDADPSPKWSSRKRGKADRSRRKRRKLSLVYGQRMAGDVEDDKDTKQESDTPPTPPPEPKKPEMIDDNNGDYDTLDEILDVLEDQFQIVLPEDTDDGNFIERLHTAVLTASKHRGGGDPQDDNAPGDADMNSTGDNTTTVADPGLAALSLEHRGALEWAHNQHRSTVAKRLRDLLECGKCTPIEFQEREKQPEGIRLSLDSSGKPNTTTLEQWIDSREAVPRGTFWDAEKRSKDVSLVAAPVRMGSDQMTDDEAKDLASWALGRKAKK